MDEGGGELLGDKTRPSRIPPLPAAIVERVVGLTPTEAPAETTHWTAAAMAKVVGISISPVQRIWRAHKLRPHRVRYFKPSRDPLFVTKLRDIVGLYVDPPAHAVVLSVDEKNQVQARRRQALMKPRRHRARLVTRPAEAHRPRSCRHSHGGVNSPRHIPLRVFLANSSLST